MVRCADERIVKAVAVQVACRTDESAALGVERLAIGAEAVTGGQPIEVDLLAEPVATAEEHVGLPGAEAVAAIDAGVRNADDKVAHGVAIHVTDSSLVIAQVAKSYQPRVRDAEAPAIGDAVVDVG